MNEGVMVIYMIGMFLAAVVWATVAAMGAYTTKTGRQLQRLMTAVQIIMTALVLLWMLIG